MALAPLESRLALYYPSPLYPGEPDGAHNWMGINVARILNCLTSDQCNSSGTLGGGTSEGAEEQEQVAVASASAPVLLIVHVYLDRRGSRRPRPNPLQTTPKSEVNSAQ
jgi:hypothetical protein